MNEYNIKVNFDNNSIYSELKNLVKTDYNSTKLKFTFDKTGQRTLFKLLYPDETCYVDEITNNILILPAGVLCQNGNYFYEISLYDENSKLTNYATGEFFVRNELVDTDEVIEPDDRVPILDELINDVDTTIVDLKNKVDSGYFDGEDGITPTIGVNGNWYLGEEDTGKPSRGERGLPGQDGATGPAGRDGYVQYTAGNNILIENNVISALGGQDVYYVYGIDNSNPFIFDGKKKGIYVFDTSHMGTFYYKVNENASVKNDSNFRPFYMVFDRDIDYDELKDGSRFGGVFYYEPNNGQISFGNYLSFSDTYKVVNWGGAVISKTLTTSNQSIDGIKTFNSIPKQSNTTAPTLDNQFANKKYVDDAIASASGGTPDNVTTRLNNNDELETIGIYTQQNTARKIWEGTLAQYNALSSKDSDTYYYIIDDNEVNGLPTGGTTGQVLTKSSNSDYDAEWTTQHNFTHETWTFTLDDDTTVDKEVVLW